MTRSLATKSIFLLILLSVFGLAGCLPKKLMIKGRVLDRHSNGVSGIHLTINDKEVITDNYGYFEEVIFNTLAVINPIDESRIFNPKSISLTQTNESLMIYTSKIEVIPNIVSVSAGYYHTVALDSEGHVWVWGLNQFSQLGDGTQNDSLFPIMVEDLNNIVMIATGSIHTLALDIDGNVWAWGGNYDYQIGTDPLQSEISRPVRIDGLNEVIRIFVGNGSNFALDKNGTLFYWGVNTLGNLGDSVFGARGLESGNFAGISVSSLDSGLAHTTVVSMSGQVFSCGYNAWGQLGDGTTNDRQHPEVINGLEDIIQSGVGDSHSIFLDNEGKILTCGNNVYGQLGDGTNSNRTAIEMINTNDRFIQIEAARKGNFAIRNDGRLFAWGENELGELGDGTCLKRNSPSEVILNSRVIAISSRYNHSIALTDDGLIWCWGWNIYGQLGDGTKANKNTPGLVIW